MCVYVAGWGSHVASNVASSLRIGKLFDYFQLSLSRRLIINRTDTDDDVLAVVRATPTLKTAANTNK